MDGRPRLENHRSQVHRVFEQFVDLLGFPAVGFDPLVHPAINGQVVNIQDLREFGLGHARLLKDEAKFFLVGVRLLNNFHISNVTY